MKTTPRLNSLTHLLKKYRWHICCAGIAASTYLAVFCVLYLPGNFARLNFIITAFPASIIQFLLIDFARHGYERRSPSHGKDPFQGQIIVTRVIRPIDTHLEHTQPRIMSVQRPQPQPRIRKIVAKTITN